MKTMATRVTDRGQISIPGGIRRAMGIEPGDRLCWEKVSGNECRVVVAPRKESVGAMAMLGYAKTFRTPRRTADWIKEFRGGEGA